MPLYEITADKFRPLKRESFAAMKVKEREDLQRLLRTQIEVLGDDLYVLAEEFGDWEDSKRRIDLLAVDRDANLVVIELKRTSDGGHMELQAIRYASMVSAMAFDRATDIHADFLKVIGEPAEEASERILKFLKWDEPDEQNFASDVRIILVSEDFGRELTTAVLWLRERDIDIRCVRLRPYLEGETKLVDVQQLIPLPEANEYQVKLREKGQVERKKRAERYDLLYRFWEGLIAIAEARKTRHAHIKPGAQHWLGASAGSRGLALNYVVLQDYATVELYIDTGEAAKNKSIFDACLDNKAEIERTFGKEITWERLDTKRASRIKVVIPRGGCKSPEPEWPEIQAEMVTTMTDFEKALMPVLATLKAK